MYYSFMNDSSALIKSYDERGRRWVFGLRLNLTLRAKYFELMREKHLSKVNWLLKWLSWTIIDLWCNAGDKIKSLLKQFPEREILWIDIHASSIIKWKEKFRWNSRVELRVWNAIELSRNVQWKIAWIFTSQMIHHLDLEQRIICLDEIYHTLPEWWVFVVSDTFIDENSKIGMLLRKGYMWLAKSDSYHNIPPEQMQEEVEFMWFKMVDRIDSFPTFEKMIWLYPTTMMIFQKPIEK